MGLQQHLFLVRCTVNRRYFDSAKEANQNSESIETLPNIFKKLKPQLGIGTILFFFNHLNDLLKP